MDNFLSPSTAPIQPMAREVEEHPFAESQQRPKKRPPKPEPERSEEPDALGEDEQKHQLDLDA
ncbi:MAG TPA: hypothetical protein VFJ52_09185 [Terriglobia bacterium]|nr:hypothetical protein [Terriglobia bacterium]HEX5483190.1 hypothetical protein [Terriglobia bacterium]